MRIIIVGAGEVGGYLAEVLEAEHHEVVVIENNPGRAEELAATLDVQMIVGSGSSPSVLDEAGIATADVVACVTPNNELNLVAALMAKQAGVHTAVVRLQDAELRGRGGARLIEAVGADLIIDPDAETALEIMELIHSPGVDEVYPMPVGDLVVIGAVLPSESPFAGSRLSTITKRYRAHADFLVGAVTGTDGTTTIPRGDHRLVAGEHIRVLTTSKSRRPFLELIGIGTAEARRVMVLGGGAIGSQVARRLQEEGVDVTIIERDPIIARHLSETLQKVVVVQGEVTDTNLLAEESVGRMDAVIAATGEDSANVLACAFAGAEGASLTVAVLHRLELLPLVRQFGIDAALSPRTASANSVLRQVRGGTAAVATFLESDAEVDEFEIEAGCQADGMLVSELDLPDDLLLGAVIRPNGDTEICSGITELTAGNHLVVFARPDSLAAAKAIFTQ